MQFEVCMIEIELAKKKGAKPGFALDLYLSAKPGTEALIA
jgi:hypothetical protein